jgi:hypothetical protein
MSRQRACQRGRIRAAEGHLLDVGNAGTVAIAELLRGERERVEGFETPEGTSLLILSIGPSAG